MSLLPAVSGGQMPPSAAPAWRPDKIGKVERGEQWISLHALLRLAEALGVRARDLIRDL
jgi:hypothetical protein